MEFAGYDPSNKPSFVLDSSHAHSRGVLEAIDRLRERFPGVQLMAGNVATALTGWLVATFADWNLAILISSATTLLGVVIALPTIRTSAIV